MAFKHLFYALPLVTVVGERVMVVHGGLCRAGHEPGYQRRSEAVSLAEVQGLSRARDIPGDIWARQDLIMSDLLWSDPHDGHGLMPNGRGGNTQMFGGDVTEEMLAREGLVLLVCVCVCVCV